MPRTLEGHQKIERSLITTYRKQLWNPFIEAVNKYHLISPNDKIAVCISGGKDSMLLAKLMQQLQRHSKFPFEIMFLVMDPGYNEINRKKIEFNANVLNIPITIFETDIFEIANSVEGAPCYLCARMRRGHLYAKAKELGCNKIALGHHMSDVIETTLMGMMYGSQLQAMLPRLKSANFEGMELIRPLYCILEEDVKKWQNYNELEFIQCACKLTESISHSSDGVGQSKRQETKMIIKRLKEENPSIEKNLFNSIHRVHIDTFVGYKQNNIEHSFLEKLD